MVGLLDVNVLVALFHPGHVHHSAAHEWLESHGHIGWATCPLTVNGACRVLSNPAVGLEGAQIAEVARRMKRFCDQPSHVAWPAAVSLLDTRLFSLNLLRGHNQIADVYLLGLAVRQGGRLVTFDRAIPLRAVKGATARHIELV
jgi:toxin-antitoxin system PIN domain toxin